MEKNHDPLPLGTAESAVRSCVSILAAVTEQREAVLAYWLDLYYQVRRAYEIDQNNEPDPKLLQIEDLYPVLRDMMREILKDTATAPSKQTPAEFKRAVLEKLEAARKAGYTVQEIAEATKGACTEADIISILARSRVGIEVYKGLHPALEALTGALE